MARVTLFGGVNEIGGNVILLEEDGQSLLLDAGLSLGHNGEYFDLLAGPRSMNPLRDLLAIDGVPRLKGLYQKDLLSPLAMDLTNAGEERDGMPEDLFVVDDEGWTDPGRLHGILITHAHTDHVDLLPLVRPDLPVLASRETLTILAGLEEITNTRYLTTPEPFIHEYQSGKNKGGLTIRRDWVERETRALPTHAPTQVGPFQVIAIPVDHSIPGSCAFLIVTPKGKRIVYSGDVRMHGRRKEDTERLLRDWAGYAPDLLIMEGTRVTQDAPDDEDAVLKGMTDLIGQANGLVTVDFNWRDLDRMLTVRDAAQATGRTFAADPRGLLLMDRLHQETGSYPDPRIDEHLRAFVPRAGTGTYRAGDYKGRKYMAGWAGEWVQGTGPEEYAHLLDGVHVHHARAAPADHIVQLNSYQLSALVDLEPPRGSVAVRAACEPFSDEMEMDLDRVNAWLERYGFRAAPPQLRLDRKRTGHHDEHLHHLHASGHANREDLFRFVRTLEPQALLPVHTLHPMAYEEVSDEVWHQEPRAGRASVVRGEVSFEL